MICHFKGAALPYVRYPGHTTYILGKLRKSCVEKYPYKTLLANDTEREISGRRERNVPLPPCTPRHAKPYHSRGDPCGRPETVLVVARRRCRFDSHFHSLISCFRGERLAMTDGLKVV